MIQENLYKLRYVPITLGAITLCLGIILNMNSLLVYSGGLLIVGIIFLQAMRQSNAKKQHKTVKNSLSSTLTFKPFTKMTIPGFDDESPELIIEETGRMLLLFQMFPPENERLAALVTNNFAETLTLAIGAKVHHEDRELFRIESNEQSVIKKLLAFFDQQDN